MEVRFRDYTLKKKIGSGSFADIWLGKQHTLALGPKNPLFEISSHRITHSEVLTPVAEKIDNPKHKVAIKLEPYDKTQRQRDVYKETKILQSLAQKCKF